MFRVSHALLSVHCSIVISCWERAGILALLYVKLSCVFVTFSCGVLGQVWYLIVLIPDICLITYFGTKFMLSEDLIVIERDIYFKIYLASLS